MQFKTLAAAALLAATTVSAFEINTPTLNSTVQKGEELTVEWSWVDTDAETFSVYLTNFHTAHWPPTVLSLAQNVPREDGTIDVRIPFDVSSDYGWQINFINGTNTYVIYAQSPAFFLEGEGVEPEPTTSSVAPYPTATAYLNVTVTATATAVVEATKTATLCKTVSTVVFATPIVWFVEPSKVAACDVTKETVTATITKTLGPDGKPTDAPSGGKPGKGAEGGEEGEASTTGYAPPTGTGAVVKPTTVPEFTGAASTVRASGFVAVIVGAAALLL